MSKFWKFQIRRVQRFHSLGMDGIFRKRRREWKYFSILGCYQQQLFTMVFKNRVFLFHWSGLHCGKSIRFFESRFESFTSNLNATLLAQYSKISIRRKGTLWLNDKVGRRKSSRTTIHSRISRKKEKQKRRREKENIGPCGWLRRPERTAAGPGWQGAFVLRQVHWLKLKPVKGAT